MGSQNAEDITRSGESLLLEYTMSAQGQSVPVSITLTPADEELDVYMEFADGQYTTEGRATRQ